MLDEISYPNRLFWTGYLDEILAGLDLVQALNGCSGAGRAVPECEAE
jgi:hypothetical protein